MKERAGIKNDDNNRKRKERVVVIVPDIAALRCDDFTQKKVHMDVLLKVSANNIDTLLIQLDFN